VLGVRCIAPMMYLDDEDEWYVLVDGSDTIFHYTDDLTGIYFTMEQVETLVALGWGLREIADAEIPDDTFLIDWENGEILFEGAVHDFHALETETDDIYVDERYAVIWDDDGGDDDGAFIVDLHDDRVVAEGIEEVGAFLVRAHLKTDRAAVLSPTGKVLACADDECAWRPKAWWYDPDAHTFINADGSDTPCPPVE